MSIKRVIKGLQYTEDTGQFVNSEGQTVHMFKGAPPIGSMWFLSLGGEIYQADTILYKLMTGKWVSSFRYKDGNSFHLSMDNIEPVISKPTYQMKPQSSPGRGVASDVGKTTAKEGYSIEKEEDKDPTSGPLNSEPNDSSHEQALKLDNLKKLPQLYLFADGHLLNKATDKLITNFVTVNGREYSLETIFYYSVTGVLCHEFEYLDGNPDNKCFDNILPKHFVVNTLSESDVYLIRKYLEYDPEEECLLWVNRMYSNGLVGDILLFSSPKMTFGSYELVNLFGKIVPHRSVYKIVMSELGEEALESSDYVEPIYEVSPAGEPYGRERVIACFYCGDNTAITRDHIIPVSMSSETRSYNEKDVVPCCRECNSLLGNKALLTVEDRAMYLAERLTTRYASTLRAFGYGEDEINTFGPMLKSMVRANVNMKSYIVSRIDHCHKIAGSLYSEESVSHLQGLSIRSKRAAYSVIDAFIFNTKSPEEVRQFADNHAREHGLESPDIKQILNENLHPDVAIQFKFDHGYKLDVSLRQIKTVMLRAV